MVALIGPANVGKSSLFNRITGSRSAVIEDRPGTTRDRSYRLVDHRDTRFMLVDTAGLFADQGDELAMAADELARAAVDEADLLLVVVDAPLGVTAQDMAVANVVRRSKIPRLLLANKCDSPERDQLSPEFFRLGLGDPLPISARRGRGVNVLLAQIAKFAPKDEPEGEDSNVPRLAIVGRPNTGKSTLLNRLLGQNRALTSPIPGTTRDVVDAPIEFDGRQLLLLDTAGLRRRGRVTRGVERYSVVRSLRAIERADVCLVVIDASEGVTAQDAHIVGFAAECGCGVVVVANKWDLLDDDVSALHRFEDSLQVRLRFIRHVPLAQVSALTGRAVSTVLTHGLTVYTNRSRQIPTSQVNRCLLDLAARRSARGPRGQTSRLRYATQTRNNPPTFNLFFSSPRHVHRTYLRFLENGLRRQFKLEGSVVRMIVRGSHGDATRGGR